MKTEQEIKEAGGILIHKDSGNTYNDGGRWNIWIYYVPSKEEYYAVKQPTDYRADLEVYKVKPEVDTRIIYMAVK